LWRLARTAEQKQEDHRLGAPVLEVPGRLLGGEQLPGVASRHARRGIGRTFQTVLLSEADSVSDNLLVGVDAHRRVSFASYVLRLPQALSEARRSRAVTASALNSGLLARSSKGLRITNMPPALEIFVLVSTE